MQPLVSIIIPTFNRAHLIGETLDSIIAQTYSNWECIVVDDGSTDHTDALMADYIFKDSRFRYYHRPKDRLPGGNAARNMGLGKAEGDYIVFFDSDDLMTPKHVEVKLNPLVNSRFHFSIAKTEWIKIENRSLARYYNFDKYKLTVHNYIAQNINWLTLDICIKANIAKSINFNEKLQSGQEFNYFSKLLLLTINGISIDKVVSLRRMHKESVQSRLKATSEKSKSSFTSKWQTYLEIHKRLEKKTKKNLFWQFIKTIYKTEKIMISEKAFFVKELYKVYGFKANLFLPMLFMKKFFNRGYKLRNHFDTN
tara:strand:- start:2307 stop:3236 length:930 start_codon:yes stop_codon:yes gene_type:complete